MATAIITGSGGLVGSAAVQRCVDRGFEVIGLDNDMRSQFFGPEASTRPTTARLVEQLTSFRSLDLDIRDAAAVDAVVAEHRRELELVIHAAAQPSHDWAAGDVHTDFGVNAVGTLNLLEALRRHRPDATFVHCSTNKVYGDRPNGLPFVEHATRYELPPEHRWYQGIDTSMSVDQTMHSLFGVSKLAADALVQEYGRYFGMPTGVFRAGCMTGAAHAGAKAHGFLSYLMRCAITGSTYCVLGYRGKQVRDNIHADDVVRAFLRFHSAPRPGAVYNLGGGRESNCSVLEAIALAEELTGREMRLDFFDEPRRGDHQWWISDMWEFTRDYPGFQLERRVPDIMREIHDANAERWRAAAVTVR